MPLPEHTSEGVNFNAENKPLPDVTNIRPHTFMCNQSDEFDEWWPYGAETLYGVILELLEDNQQALIASVYGNCLHKKTMQAARAAFLNETHLYPAIIAAVNAVKKAIDAYPNEHRVFPL